MLTFWDIRNSNIIRKELKKLSNSKCELSIPVACSFGINFFNFDFYFYFKLELNVRLKLAINYFLLKR